MILLKILKGKAELKQANLFFIELLVVLLFFSFSIAVILKIFAVADYKQNASTLTEKSIICAQSIAEVFSVNGDIADTSAFVFGEEAEVTDGVCRIMLDDDMKPSADGKNELIMTEKHDETSAGVLSSLNIAFSRNESEIYALECYAYISSDGGAADE
ncbi:MAG: hypothetical protein IJZ65_03485 [Ruminiclostridium sp.]|nr:hypothetical protein [Ruminiclostridium sp.]